MQLGFEDLLINLLLLCDISKREDADSLFETGTVIWYYCYINKYMSLTMIGRIPGKFRPTPSPPVNVPTLGIG